MYSLEFLNQNRYMHHISKIWSKTAGIFLHGCWCPRRISNVNAHLCQSELSRFKRGPILKQSITRLLWHIKCISDGIDSFRWNLNNKCCILRKILKNQLSSYRFKRNILVHFPVKVSLKAECLWKKGAF